MASFTTKDGVNPFQTTPLPAHRGRAPRHRHGRVNSGRGHELGEKEGGGVVGGLGCCRRRGGGVIRGTQGIERQQTVFWVVGGGAA